jgi:hypothetical protein
MSDEERNLDYMRLDLPGACWCSHLKSSLEKWQPLVSSGRVIIKEVVDILSSYRKHFESCHQTFPTFYLKTISFRGRHC